MSLNPEWNITCRICLQEGEIRSIFERCPESSLSYCAKVMKCTSVVIQQDDSLPGQICVQCIEDLKVAYRFRVNCESSDAILQSYREASVSVDQETESQTMAEDSCSSSEIQIPISSDVLYSYKPPSGLNVKLVSREPAVVLPDEEMIICDPTLAAELRPGYDEQSDALSDGGFFQESQLHDENDTDSLITYDDALPPSSSRGGDLEEEDDDGIEERSELIGGLVLGDSHTVDCEKQTDDSSADIFFSAEMVYVDKEDDILDQLADIKRESDVEDWEVIYDDDENSDSYFQKLPQPKISSQGSTVSNITRETDSNVEQNVPAASSSMKTIQTIRKSNIPNEEKPTIENITTKPGPDGSMETVIRVKRNLKTAKQQHICKLCNSSYKYKHALETHLRRHRGDKPYKCTDCDKAFVVPFELRRHMRTHTGAKPYKCKYCERKFSDFGSKIKHERTHTGERPYVCEICEKSFTYSHVLNSHMLIHTGVKKYSCPDCGKRFAKSHHLKAHLNTHVRASNNNNTISNKSSASSNVNNSNNNDTTHGNSNHITSVLAVDDTMGLNPVDTNVDQLMVDSMDNRSTDFQLEDPTGGNPFGQLVNIADYMISSKNEATSIGTIMDDCVIHDGVPDDDDVVADVDDDALLNVVTVLTPTQVAGLVEADYANIRIINGTVITTSQIRQNPTKNGSSFHKMR